MRQLSLVFTLLAASSAWSQQQPATAPGVPRTSYVPGSSCHHVGDFSDEIVVSQAQLLTSTPLGDGTVELTFEVAVQNTVAVDFSSVEASVAPSAAGIVATVTPALLGGVPAMSSATSIAIPLTVIVNATDEAATTQAVTGGALPWD